jgi:hypothetical protein
MAGMKFTKEEAQRLVREFNLWSDAVRAERAANAGLTAPETLSDHAAAPIPLPPHALHPAQNRMTPDLMILIVKELRIERPHIQFRSDPRGTRTR